MKKLILVAAMSSMASIAMAGNAPAPGPMQQVSNLIPTPAVRSVITLTATFGSTTVLNPIRTDGGITAIFATALGDLIVSTQDGTVTIQRLTSD